MFHTHALCNGEPRLERDAILTVSTPVELVEHEKPKLSQGVYNNWDNDYRSGRLN